ncbi:MAG: TM1812 family CRISPR-associated protein, partial [Lachnospiraceae bacterium]|nr:TM1812 family CRISPR-associated protein [Lachnospiraceae bacterium]
MNIPESISNQIRVNEGKGGILLLFLSDFKLKYDRERKENTGEADSAEYESADMGVFEGRQTNEAPGYYLIERAKKDNYPIMKVICITSDKVLHDVVYEGKTAYQIYAERIRKYMGSDNVSFAHVDYESNNDEHKEVYVAAPIFDGLNRALSDCDGCQVYIDYTGGFRDISFLMTTVVRYLEFKGFKTSCVAYSLFLDTPKRIIDITYIYKIMQLINAVDEFASTGNPKALRQFSGNLNNGAAERLMADIDRLAEDISLCYVNDIEQKFISVKESLDNFERISIDKVSSETMLFISMIREMVPLIKSKMYLEQEVSIPNIIKWCVDNSLLQQAFTIIESKIPGLIYGQCVVCGCKSSERDSGKNYLPLDQVVEELKDNINQSYKTNENYLIEQWARKHKGENIDLKNVSEASLDGNWKDKYGFV